jgi:hypothetical protein
LSVKGVDKTKGKRELHCCSTAIGQNSPSTSTG